MVKVFKKIKYFLFGRKIIFAEYDFNKEIMTVKYEDNTTIQYKGSSTVWRKMPYMNRCSTSLECTLSDLHKYNRQWRGAYPNAHINPKK